PKVPAADQQALRQWIAAGAPGLIPTVPDRPPDPALLAARVKEVFRPRCLDCHDGARAAVGVPGHAPDGLGTATKKAGPGRRGESTRSGAVTAADDRRRPPAERPRLSPEETEAVRLWIAAGAPPFPDDVKPPTEAARDGALAGVVGVDYVLK